VVVHTLGRATHISKKEHGVDAIASMMRAIDALYAMRFTQDLSVCARVLALTALEAAA
jgi:hypothetical protein